MNAETANNPEKQSSMSPNQARLEASRLFRMGKTYPEIAESLKNSGYLSIRGTPLSTSGVGAMLKRQGKRRRFPKQTGGGTSKPRERAPRRADKSEAVRSILLLKGMDADEKIALALLLLGS